MNKQLITLFQILVVICLVALLLIIPKMSFKQSPGFIEKEGPCGFPNDGCVTIIEINLNK